MTAAPYRVLITGSRDWAEPRTVGGALTPLLAASVTLGTGLVLAHGACPSTATTLRDWVRAASLTISWWRR